MEPQIPPADPETRYRTNSTEYETNSTGTSLDDISARVQDVVHEGLVRRVIVKSPEGQVAIDVPLAIVVIAVVAAPWLVAIGAVLAVATNHTLSMERREEP